MRKPVRRFRSAPTRQAPPSQAAAGKRPGAPVDFDRVLLAVMRDWRWVLIALLVGAVVGVTVAKLVVKRTYTATTVLIWEPDLSREGAGSERNLLTRIQSVKLSANLLEVRRRLGLYLPLKVLELRTFVRADPTSNLVTISGSDSEPAPAAVLADTLVEVFLDHEMRLGQARAQEGLQKLETDLDVARTKLASARETYDAFRTEHGIADLAVETQIAIQHVAELRSSADVARADAEALDARATRLDSEAKRHSTHQVQGSSRIDPVRLQLANARSELANLRTRLAPDHPHVIALEAQVEGLQQQAEHGPGPITTAVTVGLNAQVEALKSTMAQSAADREAAVQRQDVYKRFASEAELRLQKLSSIEGQASNLLANIKLHEDQVSRLEAAVVALGDEARTVRPEFRALTPALVPEEAESSRKKVAIASPIVAALLALLVLVGRELRGFKVMTATEAGYWANGAVVASSTWPRESDMLAPLVDELADHAPHATGTTLVLGATDADAPLAREIAYWLSTLDAADTRLLGQGVGESKALVALGRTESRSGSITQRSSGGDGTSSRVAAHTWEGESDGQAMRRAARLAARVLIVLRSGSLSMWQLGQIQGRLGRKDGIGVLLVGMDNELIRLRDRAGDVDGFWRTEHVDGQP